MTRPDYCPIAQEPCQAMCVLTGVRCQLQPVKPASTEDLKTYQSIADNYKKGTTMNQHDQMQHDEERLEQLYWEFDQARKQSGEERLHFKGFMRGYASHVNETPNNEHESDDVLKRAPLVRLTDDDFEKVYLRFVGLEGFSPRFAQQFANALMEAMERVNGGQA